MNGKIRWGSVGLAAVGLLTGLLAGCALPEEDFPSKYADTVCAKLKKCDRSNYENSFDSFDDCAEQFTDAAETASDFLGALNLDYNEDNAKACISSIRGADCGEFDGDIMPDECDHVWD